ncbi:hypothetical protein MINTM005_12970 [Mycobacterium intracellulare]|uniref:hypothetical protein n=1 Tax=Mycobacterium intracellulare TaxID=1767 RepID=UPI0019257294|nr:hypothetical protein [Mycobacterium intracellulare]BCO56053.1 hypothetical protein MINTM005_12970 [Mycobacterium intracellulare]
MRIDIIHMRDPDSSCDIEIYVNGQKAEHPFISVHEWSFDPGAGYDKDEIEEMRRDDIDAAPDFLKPVIEEIWDEMAPAYEKWSL